MSRSNSSPQSSTTLSASPSLAAGLETKPRVTPWQDGDAVPADLLESMQARRPNRELIGIDRYLLKSVPLATGWNGLLGRVRKDFALSLEYRELIMCRVAVLNRAEFEWQVHQPAYLEAGGTQEKCDALREEGISSRFNEEERALLALTDQSTRQVEVDGAIIETLKTLFGEQQTAEAVATVAAYNMVSRFLVALAI
ncbi:carboxymuconolactone decarboxylase family protein [Cobetia amphilecti]|uniref:carboxymuconolactone decarboxylase family protein n=1 Tax=Cobetia amphilecti TaxID=1055104 RepID=UPI003372A4FD